LVVEKIICATLE